MAGAFSASPLFGQDEGRTAAEVRRAGWTCERWIDRAATGLEVEDIGWPLVQDIHRMWFESTFPDDAGRQRSVMVLNRKNTAVAVDAIVGAVESSCGDWRWRQEHLFPADGVDQIEFAVAEANELVVRIYDIHPFLDGNTRATFSLRNLLLVRAGLYALQEVDVQPFLDAWWNATPGHHERLDEIVIEALVAQDLRREEHNRLLG
jgi:fido (protein-threonine AMPylation protein)